MVRTASFGISRFNPLRVFFFLLSLGLVAMLPSCGGGSDSKSNAGNGNPAVINHIVFMLQENRSFDNYFGKLNDYRQSKGLPADVDGLNGDSGNPSFDKSTIIRPFRWNSVCHLQISPGWDESHRQFNRSAPASGNGTMDGFVYSAANYSRDRGIADQEGLRAMGYFDQGHLPY
jgi:phospholipase C